MQLLKGRTGFAIKLTISVLLIGLLLWGIDWQKLRAGLSEAKVQWLGVAFACFTVQFPLSAWKWQKSLAIHDLEHGFGYLLRVLSIGFFFNNFLPTSIGGDGYRVYKTMPRGELKSRALSSVLFERIVGFAVLILVGLAAGVWLLIEGAREQVIVWFVILAGSGTICGVALLIALWAGALRPIGERLARVEKLRIVSRNLGHIYRSPRRVAEVFGISVIFQLTAVLAYWALYRAIGASADAPQCAVIGAISSLAAVLPLSVGGIGLLEGSFVAAALGAGLDQTASISVALLTRIAVVILSMVCGLVFLFDRRENRADLEAAASDESPPETGPAMSPS